jgi:hypothetical protein
MTHSTAFRVARVAVLALCLTGTACVDDTVVSPVYGAGCDRGALRPGRTILAALDEDSCVEALNLYSLEASAYAAHELQVEAGRAYIVRLARRPDPNRNGRNGLYPVLSLWGRGAGGTSAPVSMSYEDGIDSDAEVFFVAPRSERFNVVASSYDRAIDYASLGGYALSATTCPVLKLNADTGSTTFTLRDSECVRGVADLPGYGGEAPAYNFITVKANPNERISLAVTANDFMPTWEAFGPSLDTYAYLGSSENVGPYRRYIGEESRSLNFVRQGGTLTIAIGGINFTGPSRQFTLRITRTPLPAT